MRSLKSTSAFNHDSKLTLNIILDAKGHSTSSASRRKKKSKQKENANEGRYHSTSGNIKAINTGNLISQ